MGKIRIKLDRKALDRIGRDAVERYAKRHSNECAYCHKRIKPPKSMPGGTLPVCDECAKIHGLV